MQIQRKLFLNAVCFDFEQTVSYMCVLAGVQATTLLQMASHRPRGDQQNATDAGSMALDQPFSRPNDHVCVCFVVRIGLSVVGKSQEVQKRYPEIGEHTKAVVEPSHRFSRTPKKVQSPKKVQKCLKG